ncbi:MAG: AEC family transporter [Ruminococcus sp.]|nr:AEC family transporter [Ruminococcus sp.]
MLTENLLFSLNASMPIVLLMIFGYICRKVDLLDDHTTSKLNKFTFKAALPALLFKDLSTADFRAVWDGEMVGFCVIVTILSVAIAVVYSLFHKDKAERGEIIQASYRSSAAVLGIAFVNNIYGESLMAALMIVGTVPIYNIIAVAVLAATSPDKKGESKKMLFLDTLKGVVTNPIIIGIAVGILWSLIKIPQPAIMSKTVGYMANMATPLSLIALGASFKVEEAKSKVGVTVGICFIKLILFCGIFLPIAINMGFRGEKLVAVLVMLGSATTGSCFVMVKNFGHKGTITAFAVMLTTICSAFTLTLWLFLLRSKGYI